MVNLKLNKFLVSAFLAVSLGALTNAAALEIYPGESVVQQLKADKDVTFTLEIPQEEAGLVTFKITDIADITDGEKISGTPKVTLCLSRGKDVIYTLETKRDFDAENAFFIEGLDEGKYTLTLQNAEKFSDIQVSLILEHSVNENTEHEFNNTKDRSTPLEIGKNTLGGVRDSGNEDWYNFEMPYFGYAFVSFSTRADKLFEIYDENMQKLSELVVEPVIKQDGKYGAVSRRIGLSKGKYFIKVSSYVDGTHPLYALSVSTYEAHGFESEYNDSMQSADIIELGKEYKGDSTSEGDADFFKFTLTQPDDVEIVFTDAVSSSTPHYSLYAMDRDGKVLQEKALTSTNTLSLSLAAGEYYFEIVCPAKKYLSELGYRFTVNAKKTHNAPETKPETPKDDFVQAPSDNDECTVPNFSDVTPEKWYYNDVENARLYGLMKGVGEGLFDPDGTLTVAEAIAVAARQHREIYGVEFTFDDTAKIWYRDYVTYAYAAGIIKDGDFEDYTKVVTRGELAYIFDGALKTLENAGTKTDIRDVDDNTKYAESIYRMYSLGILQGDDTGTFRPEDSLKRSEMAAVCVRAYKHAQK